MDAEHQYKYRWHCQVCGLRGKTDDRKFICHMGKTRIVPNEADRE